jgi:NAD(P)-dependent dehydrogenase (short-subunit alcohol dehydrogenase family)
MYEVHVATALASKQVATREEFLKQKADKVALKILADPEDIAAAILFLASNESKFITGVNLIADGGNHLQFAGL